MWDRWKAQFDALLDRFMLLVEEAEGICHQPLHPEDVLGKEETVLDGSERPEARPE